MNKYFIINKNLRLLRKKLGLTQEEFSALLKIKRSLLGAYEEYRAEVKTEIIKHIIEVGYLPRNQLYDFMFSENYKPTPSRYYKKTTVLTEYEV